MAAIKANNRTRMAAELPDDIILHIIARLPLKYAARCRVLNKHLYNAISTPKFVLDHHHALLSSSSSSSSSSNNSIIFHHSDAKFTRTNSGGVPSKSITLPTKPGEGVRILDSCNGILLLICRWLGKYYVFNPFTGAVVFLKYDTNMWRCASLVVQDINSLSSSSSSSSSSNSPSFASFDFKLVEIDTISLPLGQTRLLFRVLVPFRESKLVRSKLKTTKQFHLDYEGSFDPLRKQGQRPVYAHGCVHWLGVGATAIAAFDVESLRARIMDGPVTHAVDCSNFRIWFGLAQASLQFIRTDTDDDYKTTIIVHTHNYITQEWRVAHKIHMLPHMKKVPVPVFFDGQNVLFHINKSGNINNIEEIYVHDLWKGECRKSGEVEEVVQYTIGGFDWSWGHRYLEFFPTRARASDVYLRKMPAKQRSTLRVICLLGLQHLFLD